MGRSQPTTAEVKQQLVAELNRARAELAHESHLARAEWNPLSLAQRSFSKHKLAWIIGGVAAGAIAVRLLLPPKFRSDKFSSSDTKRGSRGLFGSLFMMLARRAAMNFASTHLKDYLQNYLESVLKRQGSDSSSHVASR
jgi:hypothetical protein